MENNLKVDLEESVTDTPRPILSVWVTVPLYMIASAMFMVIFSVIGLAIFRFIPESDSVYYTMGKEFVNRFGMLLSVLVPAIIFLKVLDRRPVSDLGLSIWNRWKDCLAGIAFAAALYLIGFGASLALGAIKIVSVHADPGVLACSFLVFLVAASMEEVMMRGYIQGRLMTRMNKFLALAIASILFALLHIFNSNIGILPLLNLWLAGLLLGASYMYTRNLWFPIMLHTAWNWIQGPVLGYEVSGTKMFPSVIELQLPEVNIINGGSFGFEGSIICTILALSGTLIIVGWYEKIYNK